MKKQTMTREQLENELAKMRQRVAELDKGEAQRKRAEEALREGEDRYRAMFNRSLYCVYLHDFEGNFLDANETALDLLGYTREEIPSINFATLLDEEQNAKALKTLDEVKRTGSQEKTIDFKLKTKDGDYVWVETESALIYREGKPYAIQGIAKDITKRKWAEETLRTSEDRYRALFDGAIDGVIIIDSETMRIVLANQRALNMYGFDSVEDIAELNLLDFIHPDDKERALRIIVEDMFEKDLRRVNEFRSITGDGQERWLSAVGARIEYQGKQAGLISFRDITENKRAEEELGKSEERYRTVLETIEEAYYEVDLAGNFTFFNDSLCRIIGVSRDEMMGTNNRRYMSDETAKAVYETFNRVYQTGEPDRAFGWEVIKKDGTRIFVEASTSLMRGPSGEPVGFRGIIRDINERKQAEDALKKSEEKLRVMFESITDGIVVTDLQGNILDVNDVVVHMSGLSREELIGQDGFALIPREDRDKVVEGGKKVVRGEIGPVRMEHEVSPIVGSAQNTNLVLGTMHDSKGNPTGFVAIAQDITERKQMEEERERLLAELEDKSQELEQLVFIASHDLRSPLVNIQGFSREIEQSLKQMRSVLEEEDIPSSVKEKLASPIGEDIADSLNYILTSSSKIDSMLAGLLKVSRLGRVSLTIEKINMKDLMAEVVGVFEFQTREAGVKLEVGRLPQCQGDRAQLNQVFSNLIDNALKFLDPERPGIIRISGRKEDRQVVYTVEDNGIGIAPENQKTVFQIFRRFAPMDTPGEGLGLNIVRRILDRHGGKIWLESEPGKGSRFHVALPIRD